MGSHFAVEPTSTSTYGITTRQTKKKRKRSKAPLIIILLVLLALVAAGAFATNSFYGSYQRVRAYASEASLSASDISDAVKSLDPDRIDAVAGSLSTEIDAIRTEINTPLWQLISMLPFFKDDVDAAHEFLDFADGLLNDIVTPASSLLRQHPIRQVYEGGVLNADSIHAYVDFAGRMGPVLQQAVTTAESISAPHVPQIGEALEKVVGPLKDASAALDKYGDVIQLAPALLGVDSPRVYLLAAQNPSEVRSTGGLPGAMLDLYIDKGSFDTGPVMDLSSEFFQSTFEPILPLTEEEITIFGEHVGEHITNCNFIPSFPRVVELWQAFAYKDLGMTYDGVIAIDPVVLQYVLEVIGSVMLEDGTVLDGTNAASYLLHDIYMIYPDGSTQDYYFADAAKRALAQFKSIDFGDLDTLKRLKKALEKCIDSGRLLAWMRDGEEQDLMRKWKLDGELFNDPREPILGIYFDDNTSSKISWWLYSETRQIEEPVVNPDGSTSYRVATTLENRATWDEIYAAPRYVYGGSPDKYSQGDMITVVYFIAPMGGYISDMVCDNGEEVPEYTYEGHQLLLQRPHNDPGVTWTYTYTVTVPPEAEVPLSYHMTPLTW